MDYVYTVCSKEYFNKYFKLMLESINKHCECNILIQAVGVPYSAFPHNVKVFNVPSSQWNGRRALSKIERLLKMDFWDGDRVFVLEPNVIIQDDIFKVFDGSFDVAYTNRHYPSDIVVNSNVWAFEFNDRTKEFLEFFMEQIKNPTWDPLLKIKTKMPHEGTIDWWSDQDFLCAVYKNGHKIDIPCTIKDISYKYNFWPEPRSFNLNESIRQLKEQMGNKEYKILNFKGKTRLLLD